MIKKEAYLKIGTHEKFKSNVVEDMEIIRSIKTNDLKGMTCVGNNTINAEMYASFQESFNGFTKNFFRGFNTSRVNFILLITILLFLFFSPFIFIVWNSAYIIIISLIVFERILVSMLSKESIILNIILHPLQILIMFIIGLRSVLKKKILWKDRFV